MRAKFGIQFIGTIFILILFQASTFAQEGNKQCKVLLESISSQYNGGCKDGLAHGKGIAKGVDTYQGKFKNGYPQGIGKYIWDDGSYYEGNWKEGKKSGKGTLYTASTKEELIGIWKDDEFFKEIVEPPYKVTYKSGITGVNFYEEESSFSHKIEFIFQRDGNQARTASELNLTSSSGQSKTSERFSGYENVTYPFKGTVEFVAPSRMGTFLIQYQLRFEITKPTSWRIVIRY